MAKKAVLNEELNQKTEQFMTKLNSDMNYKSDISGGVFNFDWVHEVEAACPFIDIIVRNPRLVLISEEDVVKIENAKKIGAASVKDLAKKTHYIEDHDPESDDVRPSKILIERSEETFNIYENRFLYTLITYLLRFILKQEELLETVDLKDDKVLEYAASTNPGNERVRIQMKISSKEIKNDPESMENEKEELKKKINRIKQFIAGWQKSELIKSLEKANVPFVLPPIKKTNLILKNPNFQIATKIWDLIQMFEEDNDDSKNNLDTDGTEILKEILNDSFLFGYYVMDVVDLPKKEQKDKLSKYAVVMINQQIKRVVSLLLNTGVDLSEQEILDMILTELKKEREKKEIDSRDVKNKFKAEFEAYLDKVENYL